MQVLYANHLTKNIDDLDKAWMVDETFILLPQRSCVQKIWIERAIEQLPDRLREGHFALLTSGTTGYPKLVFGEKSRSENLAEILFDVQDSKLVQQILVCLPLSYCYAFVNQWLLARKFEIELIITPGFKEPDRFKDALDHAHSSMLCLVGSQMQLLEFYFDNCTFEGITRLHFGGDPFPQNKIDKIKKIFPIAQIYNNYGCTEAMPRLCIRRLEESDESANIGKPLPGISLTTADNGEILFNSPYGAVGVYDENGFKKIKPEDFIESGDLGYESNDGYWWIHGRTNHIFKRYGEKIALPSLINTLSSDWISKVEFYREKDQYDEDGYVLVISPRPNELELRKILKSFRENFPRSHWPLRIESLIIFPLQINGKVDFLSLIKNNNRIVHWTQRL